MIDNKNLPPERLKLETERHIAIDSLEEWQFEGLIESNSDDPTAQNFCQIDQIPINWFNKLKPIQRLRILAQGSLYGIPLSPQWVAMWRFIIKTPALRDPQRATKNGRKIGTFSHLWNIWSQEVILKNLNEMERTLILLNDCGLSHTKLGFIMLNKYKTEFYKPHKESAPSMSPAKIVNYYFSTKLPNTIARATLYEFALREIKKILKTNK